MLADDGRILAFFSTECAQRVGVASTNGPSETYWERLVVVTRDDVRRKRVACGMRDLAVTHAHTQPSPDGYLL